MARLLRIKIADAGLNLRQVSRELGWPPDRLSQVLGGRLLLRIEDVYSILAVLELPPAEFFAELHGPPRTDSLLDLPLPPRDPAEVLPGGLTRGELFALVEEVVGRELAARRAEGAAGREADDDGPPDEG